MKTTVEQVQDWYSEHLAQLSAAFAKTEIRSLGPKDAVQGKVTIEVEAERIAASVTFWNKGDVEAAFLGLPPVAEPVVVDDRVRSKTESVPMLLDSYFKHFQRRLQR